MTTALHIASFADHTERPTELALSGNASAGTQQASRWIKHLLVATMGLNLVDAVLTLVLVTLGLATEANPWMAYFLELGPAYFMIAKVGLVSTGVAVLWRYRGHTLAAFGSLTICAAYTALLLYHSQSVVAIAEYLLA